MSGYLLHGLVEALVGADLLEVRGLFQEWEKVFGLLVVQLDLLGKKRRAYVTWVVLTKID